VSPLPTPARLRPRHYTALSPETHAVTLGVCIIVSCTHPPFPASVPHSFVTLRPQRHLSDDLRQPLPAPGKRAHSVYTGFRRVRVHTKILSPIVPFPEAAAPFSPALEHYGFVPDKLSLSLSLSLSHSLSLSLSLALSRSRSRSRHSTHAHTH
jgi:hypothetical protein